MLEWATAEDRVLITIDKDFGDFIFVEKAQHSGIIRLPDVPAAERIALVAQILRERRQELSDRSIITIRGGRVRIFRSPKVEDGTDVS